MTEIKVKSKLQEELESQGWKWLTNSSNEEVWEYSRGLEKQKRFSNIRIEDVMICMDN